MKQSAAIPVSKMRKARAQRARQRREGIVVLLLMLVLIMASGTAVFTLQSTQYEQRSSSAVSESNWARGLAECTAMAGIAFAEDPTGSKVPPTLGAQWKASGSTPAQYGQKYAIPEPTVANQNIVSGSVSMLDSSGVTAPAVSNTPNRTLADFLPANGRNRASPNYPLFADYDSQFVNVPGLRFYRAHWIQDRLNVGSGNEGKGAAATGTMRMQRTRTVVTGFAEINVWGDRNDASDVRGLHELDTIARGYIDSIQQ